MRGNPYSLWAWINSFSTAASSETAVNSQKISLLVHHARDCLESCYDLFFLAQCNSHVREALQKALLLNPASPHFLPGGSETVLKASLLEDIGWQAVGYLKAVCKFEEMPELVATLSDAAKYRLLRELKSIAAKEAEVIAKQKAETLAKERREAELLAMYAKTARLGYHPIGEEEPTGWLPKLW